MNGILQFQFANIILLNLIVIGCSNDYTTTGVVSRTEQGRDRYMLFMKGEENKTCRVIVSRTDMGPGYRDVNPGDKVRVSGDTVHWQDEIHIKAKSIQILK